MKTSYKLASVAILGALGVALVATNDAQAAESNPWTGKGKVEFKGVDNTTSKPIYPPGSTEPELTGITENTEDKDLKIRNIADADFDAHDVLSVAANTIDTKYPAITFEAATKADANVKVKMPHFVRFQDLRTGLAKNDHSISAKLTKQFTEVGGTHTLTGAAVHYAKTTLVTGSNAPTMPDVSLTGADVKNNFALELNNSVDVYSNDQTGKGFGTFELMFGPYADATGTHNDNVQLEIKQGTVPNAKAYEAEITWTIANAPATITNP